MKIEKTNLIDWLFDDGEWLSWTLLLLIPGIIIFVLVIPGINNLWSFTINSWYYRFYYRNFGEED